MKDLITNFIKESPIESGLIFLIIGLVMLVFHINKKKSIKFWDSGLMEWRAYISYLSLMLMSFIFGIILIFKNI